MLALLLLHLTLLLLRESAVLVEVEMDKVIQVLQVLRIRLAMELVLKLLWPLVLTVQQDQDQQLPLQPKPQVQLPVVQEQVLEPLPIQTKEVLLQQAQEPPQPVQLELILQVLLPHNQLPMPLLEAVLLMEMEQPLLAQLPLMDKVQLEVELVMVRLQVKDRLFLMRELVQETQLLQVVLMEVALLIFLLGLQPLHINLMLLVQLVLLQFREQVLEVLPLLIMDQDLLEVQSLPQLHLISMEDLQQQHQLLPQQLLSLQLQPLQEAHLHLLHLEEALVQVAQQEVVTLQVVHHLLHLVALLLLVVVNQMEEVLLHHHRNNTFNHQAVQSTSQCPLLTFQI